ncbi:MAG: hypothetical protein SFV51_23345 [Bryobacteraceae bacterium]|nr:hypothetical protein [Bryobacteraceae bacterium]
MNFALEALATLAKAQPVNGETLGDGGGSVHRQKRPAMDRYRARAVGRNPTVAA